jgi:hypothetical protein
MVIHLLLLNKTIYIHTSIPRSVAFCAHSEDVLGCLCKLGELHVGHKQRREHHGKIAARHLARGAAASTFSGTEQKNMSDHQK